MRQIDARMFEKIYAEYADAIFRHCYFRVRDRALARDIMQDTFMKTWQYISEGKEIANVRPFLYTVATNLIIDWSRKKKEASLEVLREETGFDPGEPADFVERDPFAKDRLLALLDKINPHYREVLVMRYVDDLRPKDIAKVLDITPNLVSVRLHHGLQQLHKLYDEQPF